MKQIRPAAWLLAAFLMARCRRGLQAPPLASVALAVLWLAILSAPGARPLLQNDPEFLIDRWETEDGLPENSATSMVQTPDGYLWFGTFDGLVRFDGLRFKVFNQASTPELPSDGIVNLHLDQRGRLWISTLEGLVMREGDRWQGFGKDDGWVGNYVRSFAERAGGDLLMTTFDGHVLVWETGESKLVELPSPPGEPNRGYVGASDGAGNWWVAQHGFIGRWDGATWMPMITLPPEVGNSSVGCVAASDGGVWVLLGDELMKFHDGAVEARHQIPNLLSEVWNLYEDRQSGLWITTRNAGQWRLAAGGELRYWGRNSDLGSRSCRSVFEDREGNFWVGTDGHGLWRLKPRRFVDRTTPAIAEGIGKSICAARDGGVWIASFGAREAGLFHCDGTETSSVAAPSPENPKPFGISVLEDRSGRLWYGNSTGCWRRTGEAGFEQVIGGHWGKPAVQAMFEDSQGRMWMASGSHLMRFDGQESQPLATGTGATSGSIYNFAEDRDGAVWLAGSAGLFRYVGDRLMPVSLASGLPPDDCLCLKADPDGTMWIGTHQHGLWRWRDGKLDRVNLPASVPTRSIHAIIEDPSGHCWITTNRGIIRAAKADLHATADGAAAVLACQFLDKHDGLPGSEFPIGQPTCTTDTGGRLWFVLNKGVAMIDLAMFHINEIAPAVQYEQLTYHARQTGRLEMVTVGGEALALTGSLPQPLKLPPGSQGLTISYSAPSFGAPEKVRFQTMLEGSGETWREENDRREIQLYGLPPGKYALRVRAANNDGVWNEQTASLAFVVQPFFWETGWFLGGSVAGLIGLVGAGVAWRVRRQHRSELRVMERTRQQQAELAHLSRVTMLGELSGSLAHELNQPLAAILSNAQAAQRFLARDEVDLDEVREILADIASDDQRAGEVIRRLRLLLKKGEMQTVPLDLNAIVDDVLRLMRNDLLNHDVKLQIQLAHGSLPIDGDQVHLQQVMLNLIVNATDAMTSSRPEERCLRVRTERVGSDLARVSLSDRGRGIPAESMDKIFDSFYTTKPGGMGLGLKVCLAIIEAHHGSLVGENNPEGGATFHFTLPIREGGTA